MDSYVHIAQRRGSDAFGERERRWQMLRRGRYIEFNLLYDRGVRFGLGGGRMESIMVSAPPMVCWDYMASLPDEAESPEEYRCWEHLRLDREPEDWARRADLLA